MSRLQILLLSLCFISSNAIIFEGPNSSTILVNAYKADISRLGLIAVGTYNSSIELYQTQEDGSLTFEGGINMGEIYD